MPQLVRRNKLFIGGVNDAADTKLHPSQTGVAGFYGVVAHAGRKRFHMVRGNSGSQNPFILVMEIYDSFLSEEEKKDLLLLFTGEQFSKITKIGCSIAGKSNFLIDLNSKFPISILTFHPHTLH